MAVERNSGQPHGLDELASSDSAAETAMRSKAEARSGPPRDMTQTAGDDAMSQRSSAAGPLRFGWVTRVRKWDIWTSESRRAFAIGRRRRGRLGLQSGDRRAARGDVDPFVSSCKFQHPFDDPRRAEPVFECRQTGRRCSIADGPVDVRYEGLETALVAFRVTG